MTPACPRGRELSLISQGKGQTRLPFLRETQSEGAAVRILRLSFAVYYTDQAYYTKEPKNNFGCKTKEGKRQFVLQK